MRWIRAIFETIRQSIKTRDRLFVRIVPCVCGSLDPKMYRFRNDNWIVFCPSCRNRTVGGYKTRRRAKIVWKEQNEMKG